MPFVINAICKYNWKPDYLSPRAEQESVYIFYLPPLVLKERSFWTRYKGVNAFSLVL